MVNINWKSKYVFFDWLFFIQANIYKYHVVIRKPVILAWLQSSSNLDVEPGVKRRNFIDIRELENFYSFIGEN